MENNSMPNSRSISRKQTYKRGTDYLYPQIISAPIYNTEELKMLLLLGLVKTFSKKREMILEEYEQQKDRKLKKTGMHFNRLSSTLSIEPMKKQIININNVANSLIPINEVIQEYFINAYKKPLVRKSVNVSLFNSSTISFDNIKNTQTIKFSCDSNATQIVDTPKRNSHLFQQLKENRIPNKSIPKLINHRRYRSDFQFQSRKSSPSKQMSNGKRRQNFFIAKKKQQMKFLRKMTVQFTTQQAQFKALMEVMQVFVKNYNRASYYLKMIDQNIGKCEKIHIYIHELTKIFNIIHQIFVQISKMNTSLNIKQDNSQNFRVQFKQLPPQIQEYYQKSYQLIKIIRHFSLSQIFPAIMKSEKQICTKLVSHFMQARYILKYLEKQIEISESAKKQNIKLPKWQKAYRVKFLPKNNLC